MMRRLPPVHSPVSWGALGAAWGAAVGIGARTAAPSLAAVLRADFDADEVLLTDSGTTALALAIAAALHDAPGAAVALPAYSCYDVATAADAAGVPVLLYDLEPDALSPAWESLDRALAAGAGAVVVAHLYGYPADVPRALERCRAAGAVLIEDAAQGAGARLAGRSLGTSGPLAVLSFGRGKGISGGAGGALLARGAGVPLLEHARHHVTTAAPPWRALLALTGQSILSHPAVYGVPAAIPWLKLGETLYRAPAPARGISRVSAAAARCAIGRAGAEAVLRRGHAAALERAARAGSRLQPITPLPAAEPGYLRLAGRLEHGATPPPTARRLGIMPGYPQALADLDGFRRRIQPGEADLHGARSLATRLVTLPTHRLLQASDLATLQEWLRG